MKKILFTYIFSILTLFLFAQEASVCDNELQLDYTFNYQGFVQFENNQPIIIGNTSMRINISKNNPQGNIMFSETHSVDISKIGFFSVSIGSINQNGLFDFIEEIKNDPGKEYYIDVSIRTLNNSFQYIGSKKITTVPYAIVAHSLDAFGNRGTEGDEGPQGVQGLQGIQGINGINGLDGATGIQGQDGIDGFDIMLMRDSPPSTKNIYVDDGTNTADGQPHLRYNLNGLWVDL